MKNELIKSLIYENLSYVVILVLSFFLFKSCNGGNNLKLANYNLKKEVKGLVLSYDKLTLKNNSLKNRIVMLEKQKQKVKTEIVYVQKKTQDNLKKVPTLNTNEIAKYYKERYKLPVLITQYGVSLSDTIAKKNITELIQKDGCFEEIKLAKTELQLEEQKGIVKDSINANLFSANTLLNKAVLNQNKIIENTEKSFKKEKSKKTFWQAATGVVITGATYLLIVK